MVGETFGNNKEGYHSVVSQIEITYIIEVLLYLKVWGQLN